MAKLLVAQAVSFLPRPADYLFLYFLGIYVLLLVMRVNWKLSILGAIAFGFSTYFIIILGVVSFGIVFAVINYFISYKIIVCPIKDVVKSLKDISEGNGDLTRQLRVKGKDEVAELADGFNHFTNKIRGMVIQINSVI